MYEPYRWLALVLSVALLLSSASSLPLSPEAMNLDCSVIGGRVSLEIGFLEPVRIEYYDSWNPVTGWKPLCTNCGSYERVLQSTPERHNLLIMATDSEGYNVTVEIVEERDKPIEFPGMIDCYWRPELGEDGCYNVLGEYANEFGCTECEAYLGSYFDGEQCVIASGCGVTEPIFLFRTVEECEGYCI
jgi:hypothetical protein